jgi:hypothetical protein
MNNFTISERLSDDDLYPQLLKLNTTFLFALCSERIPTFLFTCPFFQAQNSNALCFSHNIQTNPTSLPSTTNPLISTGKRF